MITFQEHVPLAPLMSYRIGGKARYFFDAKSADEVKEALRESQKKKLDIFILGGGTNLLTSDKGFPGLVLRPNLVFMRQEGSRVTVGAGTPVEDLLRFAVEQGLSGLEWAGGLPGAVGGAVRGNAGAFGGEIKDSLESVVSVGVKTGQEVQRKNPECRFGYRSSVFKEHDGEEVILAATLNLAPGDPETIKRAIDEKIAYRASRHPIEYPNIGSIFKNVPWEQVPARHREGLKSIVKNDPFPVVPTAYLLSEAGVKGVSFGGAMISSKHPNFIVNALGASQEDVKHLIELAEKEVKKRFGIELEEEIIRLS